MNMLGTNTRLRIKFCLTVSVIFSLLYGIGYNYNEAGTLYNKQHHIPFLWLIIVFAIFFVTIFLADIISEQLLSRSFNIFHRSSKAKRIIQKHPITIMSTVLMMLWLPYCIIQYPGSAWWDCQQSIKQIYGIEELNNWVPIAQTFLIGLFLQIGDVIDNLNFGFFLYIVAQMFFASLVVSEGLFTLYKRHNELRIVILGLVIYGFVPIYPIYLTAIGKDANWSCCILLLLIYTYKNLVEEDLRKRNYIIWSLAFLGTCLLRNAGVYIAIGFGLSFLINRHDKRNVTGILIGLLCLVIYLWNMIFLPLFGVSKQNTTRDNWNIQFQQIGRYVRDYPEDITEDDVEAINLMLSYDMVSSNYNPNLVDDITVVYHGDTITENDKARFMDFYWSKFRKHPLCYLDAIGEKSYGYFSPFVPSRVKPFTIIGVDPLMNDLGDDVPSFEVNNAFDLARYRTYVSALEALPIIKYLTRSGFWVWMVIFTFIKDLFLKHKNLLLFIPVLFILIGLLIVPANNYFRYVLSLCFVSPFLFVLVYTR